jgi:hypothetical protein
MNDPQAELGTDNLANLVAAYKAWDDWARQVSERAAAAIAASQKPPTLSANSGARVAAELAQAEQAAATHLGITASRLHDQIVTGRRDGLTVIQAVAKAVEDQP